MIPAQATRMSNFPKWLMVESIRVVISDTEPALAFMATEAEEPISSTTASAAAWLPEKLITTFAPSLASLKAIAFPIPREAPVTRATLPERGLVENIVEVGLIVEKDDCKNQLKIEEMFEVVAVN